MTHYLVTTLCVVTGGPTLRVLGGDFSSKFTLLTAAGERMSDAVDGAGRTKVQFGLRSLLVLMTVAAVVFFVFAREPQFVPTIGATVLLGLLLYFSVSIIAQPERLHREFRMGFIAGAILFLYFSFLVVDGFRWYVSAANWFFLDVGILANVPALVAIGAGCAAGWLARRLKLHADALEQTVAAIQRPFLAWLRQGNEAWHAWVRLGASASIALLLVLIAVQLAALYLPVATQMLSSLSLGLSALLATMLVIVLKGPAWRLFAAYSTVALLNTWFVLGNPFNISRNSPVVSLLQYFHRGMARTVDEYGEWETMFVRAGFPVISIWLGALAMVYVATRPENAPGESQSDDGS